MGFNYLQTKFLDLSIHCLCPMKNASLDGITGEAVLQGPPQSSFKIHNKRLKFDLVWKQVVNCPQNLKFTMISISFIVRNKLKHSNVL